MNILDALGDLLKPVTAVFQPITDLIAKVVPSGDARVQLQAKLVEAQMQTAAQVLQYQQQLLDAQKSIIVAEAQGGSWLQKSWRPITMLTFLSLTVCDSFGWLPNRLAPEAWTLLQLGLGGYVAGRSLEKIAPVITNAITSAKKT